MHVTIITVTALMVFTHVYSIDISLVQFKRLLKILRIGLWCIVTVAFLRCVQIFLFTSSTKNL